MLNRKITLALITCAVFIACTTGCDKSKGDTKTTASVTTTQSANVTSGKVQLKSYNFPEFLNDIKIPDELSRKVYSSFDETKFVTEVTKQPFSDMECLSCIDGMFYTFKEGKYMGLADINGEILVEPDTYTSIEVGSSGILVLSYDKEMNTQDVFAIYGTDGSIKKLENYSFDENSFAVTENLVTDENKSEKEIKQYTLSVNGTLVADANGNTQWDSLKEVDMADINTTQVYKKYYKASKNGVYYYICFDRLYNYTIYEGAYAHIKLKVGESEGECYVLNYDDYSELNKIITSFGYNKNVSSPSKDKALDYIQITMGINEPSQVVFTISSDGYCLTDNISNESGIENKYFSCLDKESFVSLVLWAEQVLSLEYTN